MRGKLGKAAARPQPQDRRRTNVHKCANVHRNSAKSCKNPASGQILSPRRVWPMCRNRGKQHILTAQKHKSVQEYEKQKCKFEFVGLIRDGKTTRTSLLRHKKSASFARNIVTKIRQLKTFSKSLFSEQTQWITKFPLASWHKPPASASNFFKLMKNSKFRRNFPPHYWLDHFIYDVSITERIYSQTMTLSFIKTISNSNKIKNCYIKTCFDP